MYMDSQLVPLYYDVISKICYVINVGNIMDYIGKLFGKWLILEDLGRDENSNKLVLAQCGCGIKKSHRLKTLTRLDTSQCKKCSMRSRKNFMDISGSIIGQWKVLKISDKNHESLYYICKCSCGNEREISGYRLRNNMSSSCRNCHIKTHGMSYTATYKIWKDMKNRCSIPTMKCYKNYGERGIKVCERWLKFENFIADMGERPIGLQIDRIDNNGNYEPGNYRWVTPKVNVSNRRCSKIKE